MVDEQHNQESPDGGTPADDLAVADGSSEAAPEGAEDSADVTESPVDEPGGDAQPPQDGAEPPESPPSEEPEAAAEPADAELDTAAAEQAMAEQAMAEQASAPEPRRRRRAASRPAGPPVVAEQPVAESGGLEGAQPAPEAHGGGAPTGAGEAVGEPVVEIGTAPDSGPESAPEAPRRSRRATRPAAAVASPFALAPAEEPIAVEAAVVAVEVPVVALFQPPDESRAVRRRRREPVEVGAIGAEPTGVERTGVEPIEQEALPGEEGGAADLEDEEDEGTTRRRRRRGGRRRRRAPGGSEAAESADEGDEGEPGSGPQEAAEAEPVEGATESEEAVEGEEETPSARRRRRRRRRAGVSEEMEDLSSDDAANTVVKVREPRRASDEITSVRGSTRIEAKKQRRRDGRDAGRRRAPILTEAEFLARREAVNRVMCVREHGDRTQIAVLEDGVLVEHYVNRVESSSMVGNVYLGKVQNVLPSMEAAFVDIGRGRNAVLYAGEVNWDAAGLEGQPKRIELALKSGDSVLVQVTKDPIGHKGARLTSQISLPGRFLVYVPEGSMTGISRKLPDTERARLKGILKDVVPDGAGVIVRTAAEGATEDQLTADVKRLTAQWADITKKAKSASAPSLLYGEPDLAIKVVRDIFNEDFTTLLVQGDTTWQTLSDYIGWVAPDLLAKLRKWVEPTELYAAHRIDEQLAKALDRKVWLPSGGSLVIDRTEAMTVIDVNTGKFTGQGGNLEETVTRNNLEAAEEIVRQLRLRDIGGIIVVDFIDMVLESNRDLVLRRLIECLGRDRTKHQVAEVTSLGLVQMTRKRIGQGLLEVFSVPCEHCNGRGHVIQSEPVGVEQPAEERRTPEPRSNRRTRQSPVNLGGKQTGKTPPPPRFDEHGHPEHGHPEQEAIEHEVVEHEVVEHEVVEPGAQQGVTGNGSTEPEEPEHAGATLEATAPVAQGSAPGFAQDQPIEVVVEGRGDPQVAPSSPDGQPATDEGGSADEPPEHDDPSDAQSHQGSQEAV